MKMKKMLGCALVSAMILSNSIAIFATERPTQVNEGSRIEKSVLRTEYRSSSCRSVWIWSKYPDAWKIVFKAAKNGQSAYCEVYMERGSRDFFTETCDIITDDGRCHVCE